MKLVKRDSEWWITEIPESEDCGPYEDKAEAEEDREGLERTERWGHLRQYWTTEKPVKKAKRKKAKRVTK